MTSNILNPYKLSFYLLQSGIWIAYGIATRLVWLIYDAPPWQYNFTEKLTGFAFSTGLAFIFWAMRDRKFLTQILFGLMITALFGLLWRISYNVISLHFLRDSLPADMSFVRYFWHSSLAVLRLMPWTIGYFLITYYLKYREEKDRAKTSALQAKEAQLKLLHLQISPHFLFNVLNSLDTLLMKENIAESRKMLGRLSQFMRQTLSDDPAFNIPLKQEVERARTYVEIEKVRFQEKLTVNWHIEKDVEEFMVPSLILQPLIENAIKHSVSKSLHGGKIDISANHVVEGVLIRINNKSLGDADEATGAEHGLGIGLENTLARLRVTYGDQANLSANQQEDGSYEVRIFVGNSSNRIDLA